MSGCEVAGLALGTVALASLFSTCVELFDYLETYRNYVSDYDFAAIKLGLLRERLRTWGSAFRVNQPGREDAILRTEWPEKRDVIVKSLLGLQAKLHELDALLESYRPLSQQGVHRPDGGVDFVVHSHIKSTPRVKQGFRKRARWTLNGNKKAERLIGDVSFFIENLNQVMTMGKPTLEKIEKGKGPERSFLHGNEDCSSEEDRHFWHSKASFSTMKGIREDALAIRTAHPRDETSCKRPEQSQPSHHQAGEPSTTKASNTDGRSTFQYTGKQTNSENAVAIRGPVGCSETYPADFVYSGEQWTCGNATTVDGPVSVDFLLQRQRMNLEYQWSQNAVDRASGYAGPKS